MKRERVTTQVHITYCWRAQVTSSSSSTSRPVEFQMTSGRIGLGNNNIISHSLSDGQSPLHPPLSVASAGYVKELFF
jgi:hypothetical protein